MRRRLGRGPVLLAVALGVGLATSGCATVTPRDAGVERGIVAARPVGDEAERSGGSRAAVPPGDRPDWAGIARDTGFFLGYQAAVLGGLYLSDDDGTLKGAGRRKAVREPWAEVWWDNVSDSHFDHDDWWMNYLIHPYWGATYYVRARERGFGVAGAFVFSALISTAFEFGIESFFEQPSYQDLIVTPIAGALVGAFVFEPIRARIKAKPEYQWYDQALLVATDPLGAASSLLEWLFGITPHLQLQLRPLPSPSVDRAGSRGAPAAGGQEDRSRPDRSLGLAVILRY